MFCGAGCQGRVSSKYGLIPNGAMYFLRGLRQKLMGAVGHCVPFVDSTQVARYRIHGQQRPYNKYCAAQNPELLPPCEREGGDGELAISSGAQLPTQSLSSDDSCLGLK